MAFRSLSLLVISLLFGSFGFGQSTTRSDDHHHSTTRAAALQIPSALKAEHQELHEELLAATKVGGQTGTAAQKVAEKLHAHFVAEEEFALPPLGLLKAAAEGESDAAESALAIRLSEELRSQYPKMLAEHSEIKKALEDLDAAAVKESRPEQREFVRKLALHAETEETVLYPATLLLGQYLKTVSHKH